jgi:hypothetical protein
MPEERPDRPELPAELRIPAPRPLPPWARRRHVSEVLVGIAGAGTVVLLLMAGELLFASGVAAVAGIVALIAWAVRRSHARLLREGVAAVGVVEDVAVNGHDRTVRFRYETPAGSVSALSGIDRRLARQVGGWPQPGDFVFLVYDPKGVTRNEVWGLARSAAHDDAAARGLLLGWSVRTSALLGVFLAVTCGLPTLSGWLKQVAPSRVATCTRSYSHHWWFHLGLEGGRALTVTSNDVLDLEECPPAGTVVEKRRGELAYRLDGVARPFNASQVAFPGVLGLLGCGALAFAAVRYARARSRREWTGGAGRRRSGGSGAG